MIGGDEMDNRSIEGFARAGRAMEDALRGHLDGDKLANMFDRYCANPVKGLAEYFRLVRANGLLDDDLKERVGAALDSVEDTEPGKNDLTTEEQGALILAWMHAGADEPSMTVAQAAEYIGISKTAVTKAIYAGKIKARQPKGTGTGWVLDPSSVEDYRERR